MFFLPLIAGNPYGVGNWTNRWIWSSYSDLTRPHPKWWYSKGNPLISGKSGLVKYLLIWPDECPEDNGTWKVFFLRKMFFCCLHASNATVGLTSSLRTWPFCFSVTGIHLDSQEKCQVKDWKAPTLTHIMDVHKMYPQQKSEPYFLEGLAPLASHEHVLWLVFALLLPPLLRNLIWSVL